MFEDYVESIIENGSYMPWSSIFIPFLQINYDGEVEGNEYAILWVKECFDIVSKYLNETNNE